LAGVLAQFRFVTVGYFPVFVQLLSKYK